MTKPGIELDALIAEKVFGVSKSSIEGIGGTWNRKNDSDGFYLNKYSTDITAAWSVVARMADLPREPGRWGGFKLEHDDHGWCAVFWREYSFGETAPHAICEAALKALGHHD